MTKTVHAVAGSLALTLILMFWLATVLSELFGSAQAVIAVKTTIPWGFLILVPALMAVGGSGLRLGSKMCGPLVTAKRRRMPFIAANGLLILIPSALFLSFKARTGALDATFYTVQMIELIAGAVNIALLGLNMRDGLAIRRAKTR